MDNEQTITEPEEVRQNGADTTGTSASAVNILTDMVDEFHCSKCDCLIDVRGLAAFTEIECPKCGTGELVPARLGNFILLKLLGTGGMGGVYYARDETLGRYVAIKVMLQKLGNDPEFIETFRREARAVAKLNHPNIAQIYSFGQEKGQPYIVMELVNGEHVDEMMEEPGGISTPLAVRICYEVAQGLSAADEAGIVHGDVKPENIMLDKNGRAKVVDFGLATVAHAAAEEGIWGTPYCIDPEKIRRQKVDARADIYSLGASLFHIIAGKPPFEGETPVEVVKARLKHPPPDLKKLRPDVPDIVSNIVKRMLATERTARYPTYKSLLSDLRKAVHELGDAPVKTGRGGKHIRFKNKKSTKLSDSSRSTTQSNTASYEKGAGGKKKIIIRKDKGRSAFKVTQAAGSSKPKEENQNAAAASAKERAGRLEKRQKMTKTVFGFIGVIVLLIGIGLIALAVMAGNKAKARQRMEIFAIRNARKTSSEICEQLKENSDKVSTLVAKTKDYEKTMRDAVLLVTGEELSLEAAADNTPVTDNAALPTKNTEEVAVDNKAENSGDQKNDDKTVSNVDKEQSTNVVTNVSDNEKTNITAVVNISTEVKKQIDAENSFSCNPDDPILKVTNPGDTNLPPITIKARDAVINLHKLQSINNHLLQLLKEAELADSVIQQNTTSGDAKSENDLLEKMDKGSTDCRIAAKKIYTYLKTANAEVVEMAKSHTAEAAALEKAKLEAEKQKAEYERKQREQEEMQKLAETEREQIKVDRAEMSILFRENDFKAIISSLEDKLSGYQTVDGKKEMKVVIDRYKEIAAMKKEIISCINAHPFYWGWGHGASARDIIKASERGITLKDSKAIYPWKSVGIRQMLKFIDHYVDSRDTRITSKAQMAIGAAVYCDEFGSSDELDDKAKAKAKAKSKSYLNKALNYGYRRSKSDRLLGESL